MNLKTDIFKCFNEDWALVTAGHRDDFNMMTVSWGGLGTLWSRPVATVYVRESRYTHDFMDRENYFTVSFLKSGYRNALKLLGTKSGRNIDKMRESGLTVFERPHGISYLEASVTIVCKKLFKQKLELDLIPEDIRNGHYAKGDPHDMYIGEVVELITNVHDGKETDLFFKEGIGNAGNASRWTVCLDPKRNLYTAELRFCGAGGSMVALYEIVKDVFDQAGTFEGDDYKSERLIREKGRELFRIEDSRHVEPCKTVFDPHFRMLCPWAKILTSDGNV